MQARPCGWASVASEDPEQHAFVALLGGNYIINISDDHQSIIWCRKQVHIKGDIYPVQLSMALLQQKQPGLESARQCICCRERCHCCCMSSAMMDWMGQAFS